MPLSLLPGEKNAKRYTEVLSRSKRNARTRGIEFTLTREEFNKLVAKSQGRCMVTRVPFEFAVNKAFEYGRRQPFAPSLDRIDSSKGYTYKNCRLVCIIVNMAMNEWGEEPLRKMAEAIYKQGIEAKLNAQNRTPHSEKLSTPGEYLAMVGEKLVSNQGFALAMARHCKAKGGEPVIRQVKQYQRADGSWKYVDRKFYPNKVLADGLKRYKKALAEKERIRAIEAFRATNLQPTFRNWARQLSAEP